MIDEDPLRMLRFIRFAVKYNMNYSLKTIEAIRRHYNRVGILTKKRISNELAKMLKLKNGSECFYLMQEIGMLDSFFPEIELLFSTEQSQKYHGEGSVGIHTMLCLDEVRSQTDDLCTLWAAVLHDIGKPGTFEMSPNGMISANGHEILGVQIAREFLTEYDVAKKDIEEICFLVENHMRIKKIKKMPKYEREQLLAHPLIKKLIILGLADSLASYKEDEELAEKSLEWYDYVMEI